MLTIRKEQLKVFSRSEAEKFEDHMGVHLRKIFPEQCESLGQEELNKVVQHGIQRAKAHGIVAQRDVCKYIDLMMVFGRDFDTNSKLPWASATLKEEFLEGHPADKIKRLCDVAIEHTKDGNPKTGAVRNER